MVLSLVRCVVLVGGMCGCVVVMFEVSCDGDAWCLWFFVLFAINLEQVVLKVNA